ncbi:hypothetical protein MUTS16_33220 [Escherichia coli]|nr:hypothetical protein MUTS16_33220 [Escherichia coli]
MHHVFAASRKINELQNWHDFFIYVNVTQGIVPWIEKGNAMKSVLKVSLAALTLAFAVSSHAADKN